MANSFVAPDLMAPAISEGRPRPVTKTSPILFASLTACEAARTPTVVGATMTLTLGEDDSRPLASR
ncbi:hypothetical protein D3C87_1877860 [compost metagenome]